MYDIIRMFRRNTAVVFMYYSIDTLETLHDTWYLYSSIGSRIAYPFRVEFGLYTWHHATRSDYNVIDISQDFSEASEVRLKLYVIIVEYDP